MKIVFSNGIEWKPLLSSRGKLGTWREDGASSGKFTIFTFQWRKHGHDPEETKHRIIFMYYFSIQSDQIDFEWTGTGLWIARKSLEIQFSSSFFIYSQQFTGRSLSFDSLQRFILIQNDDLEIAGDRKTVTRAIYNSVEMMKIRKEFRKLIICYSKFCCQTRLY